MDKKLVATRFKKALPTYEEEAYVQRIMANRLLSLVQQFQKSHFDSILEIGCGTGFFTKGILTTLHPSRLVANDLVSECRHFVEGLSPSVEFIEGDFERLDLQEEFSAVLANASLQWMEDWSQVAHNISKILQPGGIFAFSDFGKLHFQEFKLLGLPSLKSSGMFNRSKFLTPFFSPLKRESQSITLEFHSPREVLLHLKKTGVTGLSKTHWTPKDFENFSTLYRRYFTLPSGKFSLTYVPEYHIWRKK